MCLGGRLQNCVNMTWYLDYPWIVHLIALFFYGGLIVFLVQQRRWRETLDLRLLLYLGLAGCSSLAWIAVYASAAFEPVRQSCLRLYVYAQAALPLFLYAFVRAFIRQERKPYGFLGGAFLLLVLIAIDLSQASLNLGFGAVSADTLVLLVRALLWLMYCGFVVLFGTREYWRTLSPLHRNRLAYLALASPFLFADGALDMLIGQPARPLAAALQMVGMLVIVYATFRHALVDLRTLFRQAIYSIVISVFALLVYFLAVGAALSVWRGADQSQIFAGALIVAAVLTLIYQPLRAWIERWFQSVLFDQRYTIQSVVQDFSQRLSARIDLEDLAREGRTLLERAMGARAVTLVLVSRAAEAYILRPVLAPTDVPPEIRLDAASSIANALARAQPLLQYDVDRLPQYADVPAETRAALQRLGGEVCVPVLSRGTWIGAWSIGARISGDRYSDADLSLLATLADQSAVALENARLLADLREQMVQMRAMRDYLDSTMASIATGVLTLNRDGKIISFNRAAEEMFRTPVANAIGKPYDQVLPAFQGVQLALLLPLVWTHNPPRFVRDVIAQVHGRGTLHLTLQLSAIHRGEEMVGVAMVIEDLTEQARLEMERRAQEQETQRVRTTFERYVAPTVVEGLLTDPRRVALGGERQLVTVLFADMHGFANLSEQLPPEELIKILNGYLSLAAKTILRYEGTLDKFMGDGVMAFFNAPLPQSDHAWRAACAALALQRETIAYVSKLPSSQRMYFRIGLHTGEAVVGNIGTRELMNYTAVGDAVNIAKRLQENAEGNQVLMSRRTYAQIESKVAVRPVETLVVRGRAAPVEVFELRGARG